MSARLCLALATDLCRSALLTIPLHFKLSVQARGIITRTCQLGSSLRLARIRALALMRRKRGRCFALVSQRVLVAQRQVCTLCLCRAECLPQARGSEMCTMPSAMFECIHVD